MSFIFIIITSSCARSARFATCARSSLCSLCQSLRTSIILCCGIVTAHNIIHDDKLVSEHYRDCNENSSAHVQGRRQLDLVLLLSGLCNTSLTYHVNVL